MIEDNQINRVSFESVGKELGIRLAHDTHYDALNYEYSVVSGHEIHRLDFQPTDGEIYQVTKLTEVYPFLPTLFRFLHNAVPYFPVIAKVEHQSIGQLPLNQKPIELQRQVRELVQNAL